MGTEGIAKELYTAWSQNTIQPGQHILKYDTISAFEPSSFCNEYDNYVKYYNS